MPASAGKRQVAVLDLSARKQHILPPLSFFQDSVEELRHLQHRRLPWTKHSVCLKNPLDIFPLPNAICIPSPIYLAVFSHLGNQGFTNLCFWKQLPKLRTSPGREILPTVYYPFSPGLLWDAKSPWGLVSYGQCFKGLVLNFFFLLKWQQLSTDVWTGNNYEPN